MERKLASIRQIEEIKDINGADFIQAYRVDGWWVVGKKDEFKVGDLCVYFEIDSWIPHELASFLSKGKEPREFNGIKGERLKTVKLKGQISQGLLLPLKVLNDYGQYWTRFAPPNYWLSYKEKEGKGVIVDHVLGADVTEFLGIQKWELPIHSSVQGTVRGNFPSWCRKTDQERVQNLLKEIRYHYNNDTLFEVTIKLNGSSMSVGISPDQEFVICSGNRSLNLDNYNSTFVRIALKYDLEEKLRKLGNSLMIQGELIGPGIQGNPENLSEHEYYIFDMFNPNEYNYISSEERMKITKEFNLKHVPVLHESVTLKELGLITVEDFLEFAEGNSLFSSKREGVVFKAIDGSFSFKAIANSYLLKEKD